MHNVTVFPKKATCSTPAITAATFAEIGLAQPLAIRLVASRHRLSLRRAGLIVQLAGLGGVSREARG